MSGYPPGTRRTVWARAPPRSSHFRRNPLTAAWPIRVPSLLGSTGQAICDLFGRSPAGPTVFNESQLADEPSLGFPRNSAFRQLDEHVHDAPGRAEYPSFGASSSGRTRSPVLGFRHFATPSRLRCRIRGSGRHFATIPEEDTSHGGDSRRLLP